MTAPEDAIAARRRLTNRLIAAHEAERLKPFFAPDIKVIVGDGGLITGAEAVVEAFAAQYREPGFVTYLRTPETIELDSAGQRASESGRWVARHKAGEMTGTYLACWRKAVGQWVIESELFVTLRG